MCEVENELSSTVSPIASTSCCRRFQHVVMRRTATREIVQVNFQTHRDRTWAILGNHWPSRGGPPNGAGRVPSHRRVPEDRAPRYGGPSRTFWADGDDPQ
jgi:hypothetical protein